MANTAEFEGGIYPAPKDIDAYLTNVYGDWRQIPDDTVIMKSLHSKVYLDEIYGDTWSR